MIWQRGVSIMPPSPSPSPSAPRRRHPIERDRVSSGTRSNFRATMMATREPPRIFARHAKTRVINQAQLWPNFDVANDVVKHADDDPGCAHDRFDKKLAAAGLSRSTRPGLTSHYNAQGRRASLHKLYQGRMAQTGAAERLLMHQPFPLGTRDALQVSVARAASPADHRSPCSSAGFRRLVEPARQRKWFRDRPSGGHHGCVRLRVRSDRSIALVPDSWAI